jgi:hypothetical protein
MFAHTSTTCYRVIFKLKIVLPICQLCNLGEFKAAARRLICSKHFYPYIHHVRWGGFCTANTSGFDLRNGSLGIAPTTYHLKLLDGLQLLPRLLACSYC